MSQVQINLYAINKHYYKTAKNYADSYRPYKEIKDTLLWIHQKEDKKEKIMDLRGNKFCWLDHLRIDNELISGFFASGRNEYRPPLIDRLTMEERDNPKKVSEGEKERTHFTIKIENDDVFLFLQSNYFGISIKNIINYLFYFQRKKNLEDKVKNNYSISEEIVKNNNFLTELENLNRTTLATLFLNKRVLGSNSLDFSQRTSSIQEDLKLTLSSKTKESITIPIIDIFNKFFNRDRPIANADVTRIKIKGIDNDNNQVRLDTDILARIEHLEIDKNANTGELNSTQLLTHLQNIARHF